MSELMDAEVTGLAWSKGKGRNDPDRIAARHGGEDGCVTLGGCRLRRPPV